MLPFAFPYPPEQHNGFWGVPTSTIDWCEENYVVSSYIAEALNTVTNSVFILLALFATYNAYIHKLEIRFIFASLGFCLVGVGSWLFHMTLQYRFQLLDELPMIYATCVPFWSVFSEARSKKQSALVAIGIAVASNSITVIYLYFKNPTIHQAAYGVLNVSVILQSVYLTSTRVADSGSRRTLAALLGTGVFSFLFGYFLWNLDIHLCSYARATRRAWGMPYGFVLEGHGWWHIFTGIGVYLFIIYEEYLRCFLGNSSEYYKLHFVAGCIPIVKCVDPIGLKRFRAVVSLEKQDEIFYIAERTKHNKEKVD